MSVLVFQEMSHLNRTTCGKLNHHQELIFLVSK